MRSTARADAGPSMPSLSWISYAPERYEFELCEKKKRMHVLFASYLRQDIQFDVFASSPKHFRQRARFAVARFGEELSLALFDRGTPSVAVNNFPIASLAINELMVPLMAAINASAVLSEGLAAVHFLSTQSSDMLVSLIYASPLHDEWRQAAEQLRHELGIPAVLGRAKGVCTAVDRDWVSERLRLADGRELNYRQIEGSFSNPSAAMCEHTLNFLCNCAGHISKACALANGALPSLLELYCGNGNHTLALAPYFGRILAVEIDPRLCAAAEFNLSNHGVTQCTVLCAASAKACRRLLRGVVRADHEESGASECGASASELPEDAWLRFGRWRTDAVLVDPPRCGLDELTLRLVSRFAHILYISCNPKALLANMDSMLGRSHEIEHFAIFDHFPYTPHLECGVYLRRKTAL
uniref:tRNA(Phe) (4-demethylwyosine(37)-C(7)) aminocarboxypropyltransferase n=1 Tax=Calcidiscus leptoporus TaxID=127549 RepID=A0A7S0JH67_9EUKA|mmetsp:Transcript_56393/g.129485  ORF Transcript_56393/g.129485 Transcript_56393/m.129485 type:complete len:412 (+) Transcript_56393:52-1287(+)